MVPFVSVDDMMKIVNSIGLSKVIAGIASYVESDFKRWTEFDKKPRIATHSDEGVIELMPTSDGKTYGFKYVNGHPANINRGFQTVTAFGLLAYSLRMWYCLDRLGEIFRGISINCAGMTVKQCIS